jgi:primosomal protein N'
MPAAFPRVAILHSGLDRRPSGTATGSRSPPGQADVVVGARSAVFAPLPNLGVIVVDEEHDSQLQAGNRPRAITAAMSPSSAPSSKPSPSSSAAPPHPLESYYRATTAAQKSRRRKSLPALRAPQPRPRPAHARLSNSSICATDQRHRRGLHLISVRLEHLLQSHARIRTPGHPAPQSPRLFQLRLLRPAAPKSNPLQILRRYDHLSPLR